MKTETKNWIAVMVIGSAVLALVFQWWEIFAAGLLFSVIVALLDR